MICRKSGNQREFAASQEIKGKTKGKTGIDLPRISQGRRAQGWRVFPRLRGESGKSKGKQCIDLPRVREAKGENRAVPLFA